MYRVLKKNIANNPDMTRNMVMFAALSERIRKIESRTSGAFDRNSMTTNATSSTAASANNSIVRVDVHPCSCVSTIA